MEDFTKKTEEIVECVAKQDCSENTPEVDFDLETRIRLDCLLPKEPALFRHYTSNMLARIPHDTHKAYLKCIHLGDTPLTKLSLIDIAKLICKDEMSSDFDFDRKIINKLHHEYQQIRHWRKHIRLFVLDGNIGSGKSKLLRELESRGYAVAPDPFDLWDGPLAIKFEDARGNRRSLLKAYYSWYNNKDGALQTTRILQLIKAQILFTVSLISTQIETIRRVLDDPDVSVDRKRVVFFERSAYTIRHLFIPSLVTEYNNTRLVDCRKALDMLLYIVDVCVAFFGLGFEYIETDKVSTEELLVGIASRREQSGHCVDSRQCSPTSDYLEDFQLRLAYLQDRLDGDRQFCLNISKSF